MSFFAKVRTLSFALLALVAIERSSAPLAFSSEPQTPISVHGTPILPWGEAVEICAPMGAGYFVVFTDEFGSNSCVGSGMVGPSGVATVVTPAIGLTPMGARFLTVHVLTGGGEFLFRVDSTDPLFLWQ